MKSRRCWGWRLARLGRACEHLLEARTGLGDPSVDVRSGLVGSRVHRRGAAAPPGADLLKEVSGTGRTAPVAETRVRGLASAQLYSSSTSSEWGLGPLRQFHFADAGRVPGKQIGGDSQRTDAPNLAVLRRSNVRQPWEGRRLGAQARPGAIRCRLARYERSRHGRPRPHPEPCGAAAAPQARRRHRGGGALIHILSDAAETFPARGMVRHGPKGRKLLRQLFPATASEVSAEANALG